MNAQQLLCLIIRPVLNALGAHSLAAERLLLMVAAHESGGFHYIAQVKGPALGIYQMEPVTHDCLWDNFLAYRERLRIKVIEFVSCAGMPMSVDARPPSTELMFSLAYATAMARCFFLRVPEPLPDADDLEGLARYAKKHWNTELGKARWEDYFSAYVRHCA